MATVTRTISATPDRVFAVLSDGWAYSDWVVGTAHIRDVDPSWPAVGASLHHKAGPWPLSLKDKSTVTAVETDRRLTLRAGLWPFGEATVDIVLEPAGPGATKVTIREDFHAGPLHWVKNKINDLVLHGRNTETLSRLGDLAERKETRQPHRAS
ncbi:SRPBCC family protein [Paractinoplanes rhizophilus]|jgi:uncharacterized protein YndB with AHSA1/START domain|uniref:SRPBCC family protein n=1 Tax=Paractinoplanes rhizophilus TaxID=1416877 RepID=A0ABW2HHZ6_9ACTN|nr:SRPBCC family protein [Actinoplanes sp.]